MLPKSKLEDDSGTNQLRYAKARETTHEKKTLRDPIDPSIVTGGALTALFDYFDVYES